jgi:hypothetical protein
MLRIVAAIQQFMTEFNGAVSEEEKIVAITKFVSDLMKQMIIRIHRQKLVKTGHDLLYCA